MVVLKALGEEMETLIGILQCLWLLQTLFIVINILIQNKSLGQTSVNKIHKVLFLYFHETIDFFIYSCMLLVKMLAYGHKLISVFLIHFQKLN